MIILQNEIDIQKNKINAVSNHVNKIKKSVYAQYEKCNKQLKKDEDTVKKFMKTYSLDEEYEEQVTQNQNSKKVCVQQKKKFTQSQQDSFFR